MASLKLAVCPALVLLALSSTSAAGVPVKVRLVEGNSRGFLVLRALNGDAIAHGELIQHPRGGRVESQLLLNFKDGSLRDERVTFSQNEVFRLEAYRLVQRGPSFPTSEISFERRTGRFEARTQATRGEELKEARGELEMPADLYNGMALTLLKNLPSGSGTSVQMAVFTPGPRLIRMDLISEQEEVARLGGATPGQPGDTSSSSRWAGSPGSSLRWPGRILRTCATGSSLVTCRPSSASRARCI
jgi:hypothetical protein